MNITLRPWIESDIDNMVKYANNWNIAKNLTDMFPHPYTIKDAKQYLQFVNAPTKNLIRAIDYEGNAIGSIGIHVKTDIHRLNAELGYWLAEPFWGKGIISKSIAMIINLAFSTLEVERIYARPFGSNIASQKVLEKNQFTLEARFEKNLIKAGVLEDELIYAIRRSQWDMNS